jgi:hypothetical protein
MPASMQACAMASFPRRYCFAMDLVPVLLLLRVL